MNTKEIKRRYAISEKGIQTRRNYEARTRRFGCKEYGYRRLRNWRYQAISIDSYGQFLTLWYMGNCKCWICRRNLKENEGVLDHDHDTNKVRGILCKACNAHLAWLENYPVLDYLNEKILGNP